MSLSAVAFQDETVVEGTSSPTREKLFKGIVPRAELKELSKVQNWRSLLQISLDGLSIVAAILLCEFYFHPMLFAVCTIWIGTRQHSFAVLAHDAVHNTLFNNRIINDWTGEALSWINFSDFEDLRTLHFGHHRHNNSEKDPDLENIEFPKTRLGVLWYFGRLLTGIALLTLPIVFLIYVVKALSHKTLRQRLRLVSCLLGAVVLAIWPLAFKLYLLYWLVPICFYTTAINQLRGLSEHQALERTNDWNQSRTIRVNFLEKILIAPNNVNYHHAHHLYPSVPWHNLDRLQDALMRNEYFAQKAPESSGYFGFMMECVAAKSKLEKNYYPFGA